jgi:hypothetical protein
MQIDSLDQISKDSVAVNTSTAILPWQHDLQLNLETWKQIAQHADHQQILLTRKPLKLNFNYLQAFVEKAQASLRIRSQHHLLMERTPSS